MIAVVVTWQYTFVETIRIVHLNLVNFIFCKCYPNTIDQNSNKNKAFLKNNNHYKWYDSASCLEKDAPWGGTGCQAEDLAVELSEFRLRTATSMGT